MLFWLIPPRRALLVCLLGGWALLPNRVYPPPSTEGVLPYWVMATALPADVFITKALVVGAGALAGAALRDARRLLTFRPRLLDLPILLWCLCPLPSALANDLPLHQALRDSAYLWLAWGAPYLLGRVYLADPEGLKELATGLVIAGLIYVPLCAAEFLVGPQLYTSIYGYHPFQWEGSQRYIGSRPMGFLEDGNQLGMWISGWALLGVWLWRTRSLPRLGPFPPAFTATVLIVTAIACQSIGSIILLFGGLAVLFAARRLNVRVLLIVLLMALGAFLLIRAGNLFSARRFADETALGRWLLQTGRSVGRGSFGWRIGLEEKHTATALQRPLLGWGRWDWWQGKDIRPWGLWLLVFGQYGLLGLSAVYLMFLLPAVKLVAGTPPRLWAQRAQGPAAALTMLLLITMLDSLLNSAIILPVIAAAGAMIGASVTSAPSPDTAPPTEA